MSQKVLVQDGDIEGLVAGTHPRTGLPQLDLYDGVGPRVAWTQSKGVAQLYADAAVHDVAVDEGPQQPHFLDREQQRRAWQKNVVWLWGARLRNAGILPHLTASVSERNHQPGGGAG
jgi:hypothetical protein